jgi:Na+-transporting methylmalonyl-CoA/oxaloacetate decarboxylase gamma subunit
MELNISLSLILTALGMGTVLIVLYAINLMIRVLGRLFGEKAAPAAPVLKVADVKTPAAASDDVSSDGKISAVNQDEIVAAITAAVAAFMGGNASSDIYVKPYSISYAWGSASKIENTQNL